MSLPTILSTHESVDAVTYKLSVPGDLDVFRGHFPGRPILPGVVQVDWAARLAARRWTVPSVARDFQVKFRNVISPGAKVTLALRLDRPKGRVHFEYRVGEQIMSSGRIVVEPA